MGGETEVAEAPIPGAPAPGAEENQTSPAPTHDHDEAPATCLNCGAPLAGAYCATCGQPAHLHRSLLALGHDILHGVFHFEGKIWRTLPELVWHPGRLTRRYIDGERVRFVSPMALFLFAVFLMFAVFAFTGGALLGEGTVFEQDGSGPADWQRGAERAMDITEERIERLLEERENPQLTSERRAGINRQIAELRSARTVMDALARGDTARIAGLNASPAAGNTSDAEPAAADRPKKKDFSWPPPDSRLRKQIDALERNPELLLYKLKANGYKFSWALIPISLPFVWLLFFWRRDIKLYDHAVFVTYSISFMMLLVVLLSLAASAGVSGALWGPALAVVPPIHMYRQLREAYGLSRFGTWVRLFLLLIAIFFVLVVFVALLFFIGVLA